MSLTVQNLFSKNPSFQITFSQSHPVKARKFSVSSQTHFPLTKTHVHGYNFSPIHQQFHFVIPKIKASLGSYETTSAAGEITSSSSIGDFNFDAFLSVLEFVCLASSAAVSIYIAVTSSFWSQKGVLGLLGSKVLVWQSVVLLCGIVVGAVIRRRQWRRICGGGLSRTSGSSPGVNLLERVEKLEEDLRNSATIIRVLSRQLEKLGIRFRVTRKALKEPIAEAAALAQKNSEATRALAMQEDILEKELGEIQKVLLAMQEQQQKQLELILAIAKTGKILDSKRVPNQDRRASEISSIAVDGVPHLETNQIKASARQEASSDRT